MLVVFATGFVAVVECVWLGGLYGGWVWIVLPLTKWATCDASSWAQQLLESAIQGIDYLLFHHGFILDISFKSTITSWLLASNVGNGNPVSTTILVGGTRPLQSRSFEIPCAIRIDERRPKIVALKQLYAKISHQLYVAQRDKWGTVKPSQFEKYQV